jgi:Flp pilus assembly pilin Flp
MWIPVSPALPAEPTAAPAEKKAMEKANKRKKRRGVTAMEYLVCISFILVVVIFTVQALGVNTGKLFNRSSNATNSTIKQGP